MSESHLSFDFKGNDIPVFVCHNDKTWLHAASACKVLDLKNPTLVLERHVSLKYRRQIAVGVGMPAWYVSEPGFYQLVFRSKSDFAEEFQDWVFEEVLPSIRKRGGYISPSATKPQLESLQDQIQLQMQTIEQAFEMCKESGDERGIISLKSHLLNLTNKVNETGDDTTTPSDWLSISEIMGRRGYNLDIKKVMDSLSQVGKKVREVYESETGTTVKSTPKHVGSGHYSGDIKVYPPEWFDRVETLTVEYWSVDRKDRKTKETYNLLKLAKPEAVVSSN